MGLRIKSNTGREAEKNLTRVLGCDNMRVKREKIMATNKQKLTAINKRGDCQLCG